MGFPTVIISLKTMLSHCTKICFCNNLYTNQFGFSFRVQQFYFREEQVKINKDMIQLLDIDYFWKCHVTLNMR